MSVLDYAVCFTKSFLVISWALAYKQVIKLDNLHNLYAYSHVILRLQTT
ncbi:hypothetical protein MARI151_20786 [Maribacter litoralis]|uniref:Uncharacterized protein n=1 Tax=Maribacter litoralis TaxID=2059726 RepID=A0A653RAK3_9FLAO|nr:hypothetical protein MARI151_20786 [Maribacter litoralis]